MVGHNRCSYPGLASPPSLLNESLIGAECWRNQPVCLGTWAAWAPGLSIQLLVPRIADGTISDLGNGNLTAVGWCRVPRPDRRHGDAVDEAIPADIYNASPFPP
jgi:hypothetical protein